MLKYKYLDRDITYSCMYLNVFLNNIIKKKNWRNALIWVTGHCYRATASRNRYGVEKTVDAHKILINAITFYVCLQEI